MRKIKWGVLGTAGIAKGQTIPGMKEAENCELYAIAGRSLEKATVFQTEFGFEKAYGSYEELLQDEQVEAVYIPLPNTLHYEWTIKALEAKKHVLCEKPLAPSEENARKMVETAEKNSVLLMEAFAYLHSPFTKAIKQEIENKTIGDVVYMESTFITSDYDISNIRMRRETLGGCLYDLGCYNTTQILWMLEEEPEKLQAISDFSEEKIDVYTTAIMNFKSGKRAVMNCGMVLEKESPERFDRIDSFRIHGTKGSIRSEVQFNQCGKLSYVITVEGKEEVKVIDTPQNYCLEVEQFGRCILDGEKPFVSHEFTLKNARLMDRILKTIRY
ncbi:MAG: Gfo/Idh/MocA family oxidoreductase [Lachnospiraceae bacterium]|nr:Gfo/Idh/MocA family oxidoreductase [Lachnospiraceae bacterium]